MTDQTLHQRALELSVIALDFELEPPERAWLDGHLAGCAACRRASHAYAVDARALERLPQVSAPVGVRARVLGSRNGGRTAGGGGRPWLAATAALGVVAVVGGALLLQPAQPPPGPGTTAAPSDPVASAPFTSSVTPSDPTSPTSPPTVPPSSAPASGPLVWQPIAVPDQGRPREIRALSGGAGIAVATLVGANGEPRLWWSRDGGPWSDAELPAGAFGGTAPWLVEPFGAGFLALGWTDITQSATERRIWLSPDGLAWRPDVEESGRLGPISYGLLTANHSLALALGRADGETIVWRSTDGETWSRLEIDAAIRTAELDGLTALEDGFVAFGSVDGTARLWSTPDGERWTELGAPPGLARVDGVSSAGGGILAWGATARERRIPNALAWSSDGATWEPVTPPAPVSADDELAWVTDDGAGIVALWRRLDGSTVLGRSGDGRSWTAVGSEGLPPGVELDQVVRVGDILVGLGRDDEGLVVSFAATP